MKKLFMVLAATLICGACVFTSCKKEDDLNVKEKIIGKWMETEMDGRTMLTNAKKVYTFESTTKAYISASFSSMQDENTQWVDKTEANVVISGNKVTLTSHINEHSTEVEEMTVTAISGSEFSANIKVTVTDNGNTVFSAEQTKRFVKVADYTAAILGLWECTELTGIETYNDANARLEFFDDGNYNYWRKNDNNEWVAVTDREFQNYFVDGTLLATRWKNIGEDELREWWEIATLANGEMQWTALRQNEDGTTVQQGMRWVKVN